MMTLGRTALGAITTLGHRIGQRFKYDTPWAFTTSSGLAGGFMDIGVGGGSLYVANSSSGEKGTLRYAQTGLSYGPVPATLSYSTSDMWSTGVGHIRGSKSVLSLGDLKGGMCVLSMASGLTSNLAASGALIFLGIPVPLAITGAIELILGGLMSARACGLLVGRIKGVDTGIALMGGYATTSALLDRIFS
jgi:hypothetical protein